MKIICFTIFLLVFSSLSGQFAPIEYSRNDKFEISPLISSSTITLKSLYTLSADNNSEVTGMATIEDEKNKIIELRIFDVYGIVFFRKLLPESFKEYVIDLSDFVAGAYVVEVRQGMDILSTKIIRRHH